MNSYQGPATLVLADRTELHASDVRVRTSAGTQTSWTAQLLVAVPEQWKAVEWQRDNATLRLPPDIEGHCHVSNVDYKVGTGGMHAIVELCSTD